MVREETQARGPTTPPPLTFISQASRLEEQQEEDYSSLLDMCAHHLDPVMPDCEWVRMTMGVHICKLMYYYLPFLRKQNSLGWQHVMM